MITIGKQLPPKYTNAFVAEVQAYGGDLDSNEYFEISVPLISDLPKTFNAHLKDVPYGICNAGLVSQETWDALHQLEECLQFFNAHYNNCCKQDEAPHFLKFFIVPGNCDDSSFEELEDQDPDELEQIYNNHEGTDYPRTWPTDTSYANMGTRLASYQSHEWFFYNADGDKYQVTVK